MLINDIHYHVETHGTGEPLSKSPTCLLLHGFTGSGANWQPHTEIFARQFTVITVDLLGHGQTDSPADPARYEIAHAAKDLIAIFDALDQEAINLLGYSMGGRLALYTALAYPARIKRLILE